jgi:hypothetical protein
VSLNATYVAQTQLTGAGIGTGASPVIIDTPQTTVSSTNAPPPDTFTLISGTVILLFPPISAGYAFTRVNLMPVGGSVPSTNAKTILGVNPTTLTVDATGIAGWLTGSITIGAAPGGMFAVTSSGGESLQAAYS